MRQVDVTSAPGLWTLAYDKKRTVTTSSSVRDILEPVLQGPFGSSGPTPTHERTAST
jgi:hypothetical protein